MGRVLRELGWGRDTYCVSSKVYWGGELPTQRGLLRKHVHDACHAALRRLQVDYLDLFFCHRPDLETPIEETVRAMDDLVRQGKVLYWGTSEWSAQQIQEAHGVARQLRPDAADHGAAAVQHAAPRPGRARVSPPLRRDRPGHDDLVAAGLGRPHRASTPRASRRTRAWPCPSTSGCASAWRAPRAGPRSPRQRELAGVARDLGCTPAQLAIAWCLKNPHVSTVILGASRVSQLSENLGALDVQETLTPDVLERIEGILGNKPAAPETY